MSTAVLPRGRSSRALEGMSWVGLIAGLLLLASALSLPRGPLRYAALSPKDVTDWTQAIVGAVGAIIAAANGVAVAWHRWGKPARRPAHRDAPPARGPAAGGPDGARPGGCR